MQRGWFEQPVPVWLDRVGTTYNVNNAMQAADILLNKWPIAGGRKHLAARQACLAVMQGTKKAIAAQRAFREAAAEAEILQDD